MECVINADEKFIVTKYPGFHCDEMKNVKFRLLCLNISIEIVQHEKIS